MTRWQLQEAKARLSELIKRAAKEGPQSITIHGEPTAVVLSSEEYERLKKPQGSFVEFMRRSLLPRAGLCYDGRLSNHRSSSPLPASS